MMIAVIVQMIMVITMRTVYFIFMEASFGFFSFPVNAYQCDQCQRTFKFHSWFKNHKTTHIAVGIHQCNYCPKKFKRRDNLQRHFLSHFGGVNYDCALCDQPFNLKFNLSTHIKMKHSRIDLHKCSQCEMRFKDIRNKRYHENVKHNKLYPFVCPCGAQFGAPNLLCRHRRTHVSYHKYHK